MVIILDTSKGKAYHFRTRKRAGEFMGITQPTLRRWLDYPFFLHKTLIITETRNGKPEQTEKELVDQVIRNAVNV